MPNISSETLFHFTNKENLKGILKNGFYPRYSYERLEFENRRPYESFYPLVSFCDIPLSQVKNHLEIYGKYGIGMAKTWAIQKRLNPVMYVKTGAELSDWIYRITNNIAKLSAAENAYVRECKAGMVFMLRHIKPFEGISTKTGVLVKYYDEREWRYVPFLVRDESGKQKFPDVVLMNEVRNEPKLLIQKNAEMLQYRIGFEPNDIKYIIIKDESEILQMIEFLDDVKSDFQYEPEIIRKLTSRIITSSQIKNDF